MGATGRRFTLEYRIEAAHGVIDSDRSVAEVARDLSMVETTLAKWAREERRPMAGTRRGRADDPGHFCKSRSLV